MSALFPSRTQALLALADGTVFRGRAIGAHGHAVGEVVFNTAMTGYQEIVTDPSYAGQIVTLTYPHVGNVGVNADDAESRRVFAAGLVVRDVPGVASNCDATAADQIFACGATPYPHAVLYKFPSPSCRMNP